MPEIPSISTESYAPNRLLAGGNQGLVSESGTLLTGQNLLRGALLGRIKLGAASAAAKAGGNTGNGTLTMDATTPLLAGAQAGVYTVRCITAAANNGTFRITAPDGDVLGDVVMAAGAGTFSNQVKFALADGASDFIVGDGFDITVAAGTGKYVLSLAAAVDGSQEPEAILVDDVDATAADKVCGVYVAGEFNSRAITFGTGHTAASVRDVLRAKSIFLKDTIAA